MVAEALIRQELRLMASELEPGEVRPGGRTARNREAVCRATLRELAERGYAGLTVEGVAERAGVHKTTVYRRWGGVDGLVVDALQYAVDDDWQPDTSGTVEDNLLELANVALDSFTDPETGPTHTAVVAAAFQSNDAIDAVHGFFADRFGRSSAIIAAAIERSELPGDTDPLLVVRAVMAPIYFRLFISREPVGATEIREAVFAALAAARAGVFRVET
jgi:AcrR family transcriptional regulator